MKKEIKEILAGDLKSLTSKFDFVEDTKEDVWFPINPWWSVGFSKLTTETYAYMFFSLLNRETGYVVRKLFIRREFDNQQNFYVYNLLGEMLFKGKVRDSSTLDNFDDLPYNELEHFLDYALTETQQWVLHHTLKRL